jgi:tRNA-splicing endonuclease subunit Sen2
MAENQQPTTAPVVDVAPPGHLPGGASPTVDTLGETSIVSTAPAGPSTSATPSASASSGLSPKSQPKRNLHQIYRQPLPLKIFPFPNLTSNPLSLFHLAFTWLSQVLYPPPAEPSVVHTAYWDAETRTISVIDEQAMVDLWQQGFFGKGSLSRSEPNWLKWQNTRRGLARDRVSEVETNKRRAERNRVKWDRARAEQEALEQKRLEEAAVEAARLEHVIPPLEPLPQAVATTSTRPAPAAPIGPLELLSLPNSQSDLEYLLTRLSLPVEDTIDSAEVSKAGSSASGNDDADSNTTPSEPTTLKRAKSVRFSPTVESTEFLTNDPPSPPRSVSSSSLKPHGVKADAIAALDNSTPSETDETAHNTDSEAELINREHLQLLPQEALFLTFALGALKVVDSATGQAIETKDLLILLRRNSYFPPRLLSQKLEPDDPFMIHYAAYHHFRSLGWVPRAGIKFGVDWLLYTRGPVFDHAEYGVMIMPSYSDPYWKSVGKEAPRKTWHWLMGVNRVLSKVYKSVVLVYVDVPPPPTGSAANEEGLAEVLKKYSIREHLVKRWSSNRNRD